MEIEICKPTPEQAELQKLFAEAPSKEAIRTATFILNNYSKDSQEDIICLAFVLERHSRKRKDILDKILSEFPVGNISEHTIESLPERISYYLKELAEYTQRVEDLEDKKLDPKQPICTKCVNNLTYHDGWHCMCEEKDLDYDCWVNFGQTDGREEKKKVYIVLKDECDADRKFVDVLFTRQAAEDYVSEFTYRHKYYIEEYEETDNGRSKEIY